MAKRITDEQKLKINQMFYDGMAKAAIARELGISSASVTRYIEDGWTPPEILSQNMEKKVSAKIIEPKGKFEFLKALSIADNVEKAFCDFCILTKEEWEQMAELQQELI